MKKIVINLNPAQIPEESPAMKTLGKYIPFILAAAFMAILCNLLLFGVINSFRLSYASLEKTFKGMSSQQQDIQKTDETLARLEKEKKDYVVMLKNDASTAQLMADTFSVMPKSLWLRLFSFTNDTLTLEGSIIQMDEDQMTALNHFVKDLNKIPSFTNNFKNISLKNYRKNRAQGTETMDFRIECSK